MNVRSQIKEHISSLLEPKRSDMQELHQHILKLLPKCKLWFLDGKDSKGKTVSNPNIGYGYYAIKYADGTLNYSMRQYDMGLRLRCASNK